MTAATLRPTIDALLAADRLSLDRLDAAAAAAAQATGALLVDIRPEACRQRAGEIPGSLVIDRNVLEWRLAPSSPHRIQELADADQLVVLVCNEGYASSLAAASLQRLGLRRATDLVGGFAAWDAAGLPVVPVATDRSRTDPPRTDPGTDGRGTVGPGGPPVA